MVQNVGRSAVTTVSRYVSSKIDWSHLLKIRSSNTTTVSNLQAKWSQAAMKLVKYENIQISYPNDTANRFKKLEQHGKIEEQCARELIKLAKNGELLPHKHEWVMPDEALDPINAPPLPKQVFFDTHGHDDVKKEPVPEANINVFC
ncbi:unnamed protein product [Rotaria sp. Silwood1]|nr:unnamed protein product [Rotaria sp. Silwood1]CAF4941952.1 unnamed protein product [Rotaria sp. Silwood1]